MMAESLQEPTIPYDLYMTGKEIQNRYSNLVEHTTITVCNKSVVSNLRANKCDKIAAQMQNEAAVIGWM
jgi:hypothetical protein